METYLQTPVALQLNVLCLSLLLAGLLTYRPQLTYSLRSQFRALAQRPGLAAGLLALLSLTLNLLLASRYFPQPWVHDEYSYLLASDTFSRLRLSNPPHPLWQHFESFHILSQPTYASKYPPGQGMALAIGQLLTGHPIVGVWLSLAAACVALYWMLRAWTSPNWALLGALAVTLHAPILRSWGQTYWGGAVAMLGGALVFGGLRRLWKEPRRRDVVCLGLGLLLLANSRPAEGFLAALPVFAALLIWCVRSDYSGRDKLRRVVLPLVLIGGIGGGCMAAYNRATTGSVRSMPYQVHDKTYSASSLVVWKSQPSIPAYNHERMKKLYLEFGRERALALREPANYFSTLAKKLYVLWDFFPLGLGLSLLTLPWLWKDVWLRLAISTTGAILLVQTQLASSWIFPHYLAPVAGLFYAVNVSGLRLLYVWQRRLHLGQMLVRALILSLYIKLAVTVMVRTEPEQEHLRQRIVERLSHASGPSQRHLVIVSYAPQRSLHHEYVYNEADIDAAPIVWARDMVPTQNTRLIQYFADRKCWRWHLGEDATEVWEEIVPNP